MFINPQQNHTFVLNATLKKFSVPYYIHDHEQIFKPFIYIRDMIILGYDEGHDASACLIKDGKIIVAAEEERFTRIKHHTGFPEKTIKWLMNSQHLSLDDIDYIAYPRKVEFKSKISNVKSYLRYLGRSIHYPASDKLAQQIPKQYYFVNHHLAHAASAYRTSDFETCNVLTIDWGGDGHSSKVFLADNGTLTETDRTPSASSLGAFYSALTEACGFMVSDGEFKLMGLAAYGSPNKKCADDLLATGYVPSVHGTRFAQVNPILTGITHIKTTIKHQTCLHFTDAHAKFKQIVWKYGEETVAATGQHILELLISKLTDNIKAKTNINKFCLAGGVFLNVKANMLLNQQKKEIWPFPVAGDNGLALGAALQTYYELTDKKTHPLENLYLGPEFSDSEIKSALDQSKLAYAKEKDIPSCVAELLTQQKIIAWFQGRMEFGPRALGSRSILADPRNADVKDIVNARVKFREPFRPFCPSMLYEAKDDYLCDATESPYMNIAFKVTSDKAKDIPAVVHVDGTVRPQTVRKEVNPKYWSLIAAFKKITGVPVILNTSFNVKGEPIVCTPQDAINCFKKSDIDYLAINNFLVRKH